MVLLSGSGGPLLVFDAVAVVFGASFVGMMVCGLLVGWYGWDDTTDHHTNDGAS